MGRGAPIVGRKEGSAVQIFMNNFHESIQIVLCSLYGGVRETRVLFGDDDHADVIFMNN